MKENNYESSLRAERLSNSLSAAIIIIFSGILMTIASMLFFTAIYSMDVEDDYLHNTEHRPVPLKHVSDLYYKNPFILDTIAFYEYSLFSSVSGDEVICGKDEFLFELKNRENGYDYWLDSLGKLAFSEEQGQMIASYIKSETEKYAERGISYYLVVIPNSQTVYRDKLPYSVPKPSKLSRRDSLLGYMESSGIGNYIDATINLERHADQYVLYNNTENSVTPLGAYFVYQTVMKKLNSDGLALNTIPESALHYQLHYTKSRDLARRAGISGYIENLSVSLTDRMERNYITLTDSELSHTVHSHTDDGNTLRIYVSLSHESDKSAFMYYFASTFDECFIKQSEYPSYNEVIERSPDVYLRVIHEDELGLLLQLSSFDPIE